MDDPRRGLHPAALAADLATCLRFYGRLPVRRLGPADDPARAPDFRRAPRMLPLAGVILGVPGALALVTGLALGLGATVAALLALTVGLVVTGALHEDGLADVADGFFGGATPERRLAIMRDSRIGAFGAAALIAGFALRAAALAALAERAGPGATGALLAAAALSRTATLVPLARLRPARPDGAGRAVGRPGAGPHAAAWLLAAGVAAAATTIGGLPLAAAFLATAGAALAGLGLTALARRMIGGQTGDVAGAAQQVAEIAALLGCLAATPP